MTASTTNLAHSPCRFRHLVGGSDSVKQILNQLSERAEAAIDRSRLAALPPRYLDDVGMTVGERAAVLGYDEPARDPWARS